MNGRESTRRQYVMALGAAGVSGLAGCLSDSNTGDGDDGNGSDGDGSDNEIGENGSDTETDEITGEIVVTGSSTVFPISDAMAERYIGENEAVNITVDVTGSGSGFENHFCPGDADINGASRPIKPAEEDHCAENDVTPIEMHITGDALTMAVSPKNDWADCISFDELAQIWQEDGAELWSDINDDWPDEEFVLYGPDTSSGTYGWFTENVIGEAGNHRTDYEPTEVDNIIVEGLENDPYALGYFGYAYYAANKDRVNALEIENQAGECVAPGLEAASDGTYPTARPLFIYASEEAIAENDAVYDFLEFYIENAGESWIAEEVGYVPSSDETVDENMAALEDAAGN